MPSPPSLCTQQVSMPSRLCLCSCRAGHSQIRRTFREWDPGPACQATGNAYGELINRMAAAVTRAEALPQDALRAANPRERSLEGPAARAARAHRRVLGQRVGHYPC